MTIYNARPSYVQHLCESVSASWPSLERARTITTRQRQGLADCVTSYVTPDTSLVVFGSIAREECTSQSDVDWILLIDGQSVPEHKRQEGEIANALIAGEFTEPGASGVFGRMVGSHDLVHNIGGEDDLNSNTTRRVLLLLESCPIGNQEAYDRVRRQIVKRYLLDDRGLTHGSGEPRIPRFLLNDITRYWRTVTVDFVYKQSADGNRKWALRNAKLRMSRKLIFASGLARVFLCALDPEAQDAQRELRESRSVSKLTAYMTEQLKLTPLEILAKLCLTLEVDADTIRQVFNSYDRFLAILDDSSKRVELGLATSHEQLRKSESWKEIQAISHPFHNGLVDLFLRKHAGLAKLTMDYGLF